MRISTIGYSTKQGIKNIGRNLMFSIASIATMAACIFIFGLFFALIINVRYIVKNAEEGVAITVLFDEGLDQAQMNIIGEQIRQYEGVTRVDYVSAEQAWNDFADDYFGENKDKFADSFMQDNPLANSASYSVYIEHIEEQDALVEYIEGLEGVRTVNQLKGATQTLTTFNTLITYVAVAIIVILLFVATFLIRNTIATGISIRKEEISIMKLIGATNGFVRAPFLIEGVIIGFIGSAIPLGLLYIGYNKVIEFVTTRFSILGGMMEFLDVVQVFEILIPIGLALGVGIGYFGSRRTIRKHLNV